MQRSCPAWNFALTPVAFLTVVLLGGALYFCVGLGKVAPIGVLYEPYRAMANRTALSIAVCDRSNTTAAIAHVGSTSGNSTKKEGFGYNVLGSKYVENRLHYADSPVEASDVEERCPEKAPYMMGRLRILGEVPGVSVLEALFSDVQPGGRWMPKHCRARHRVAVVVPYRDRSYHLPVFLNHMHQLLRKQELDYGIYVVEQVGAGTFNRAKLLNVGFDQARQLYRYDCYIFHDIDLLTETDHNLYTCPNLPRHMSPCIDKTKYRLPYPTIFGGVSAVRAEHMDMVNGFPNVYWGWGGEDDDMSARLRNSNLTLQRYNCSTGRYTALKHKQDSPNPERFTILGRWDIRHTKDGLNSLKYKILDVVFKKLYTLFRVDLLRRKPRELRVG